MPTARAPDHLAVAEHGGRDRRHALLGLGGRDEPVEPLGELRQAATRVPSALGRQLDRPVDRLVVDAEVRRRRGRRRMDRRREPDARLAKRASASSRSSAERADVELDEVRLDLVEVDRAARPPCQPSREPPRAGVILGEPLDVVVERVEHRRPRRPPPGASRRRTGASGARPARSSRRAGEQRAERAAEPLREAERDGVEASRPNSAAGTPVATDAFRSRAPSRWTREPALAGRRRSSASSSSSGQQRPPAELCVCSSASTAGRWSADFVLGDGDGLAARRAEPPGRPASGRPSARRARPARRTRRSRRARAAPRRSRRPAASAACSAIWFAIVAVGRKSAASCPSSSAARRWSSLTVGSSRRCSSPTSAAAIAARMPAVGLRRRVGAQVDHGAHLVADRRRRSTARASESRNIDGRRRRSRGSRPRTRTVLVTSAATMLAALRSGALDAATRLRSIDVDGSAHSVIVMAWPTVALDREGRVDEPLELPDVIDRRLERVDRPGRASLRRRS